LGENWGKTTVWGKFGGKGRRDRSAGRDSLPILAGTAPVREFAAAEWPARIDWPRYSRPAAIVCVAVDLASILAGRPMASPPGHARHGHASACGGELGHAPARLPSAERAARGSPAKSGSHPPERRLLAIRYPLTQRAGAPPHPAAARIYRMSAGAMAVSNQASDIGTFRTVLGTEWPSIMGHR